MRLDGIIKPAAWQWILAWAQFVKADTIMMAFIPLVSYILADLEWSSHSDNKGLFDLISRVNVEASVT